MPHPCRQEFVSVGVNRVVNALSWSERGTVAYGAHHMAAIFDPKAAEVQCTVVGHTGMVSCVRWVSRQVAPGLPPDSELLVTGSADLTLRVWAVDRAGKGERPWAHLATLVGHSGPVTDVAVHALHPCEQHPGADKHPAFLLVSTAGDSEVRVWRCSPSAEAPAAQQQQQQQQHPAMHFYGQGAWSLSQTLPYGTQIQHAVALTHLPHDPRWLLLATGGTDTRVHLHVRPPSGQFTPALKLSGHENWVRSLAFKHVWAPQPSAAAPKSGAGGEAPQAGPAARQLLLASASQDRYARIWCIHEEGQQVGASSAPGQQGPHSSANPLQDEILRYAPRPNWSAGGRTYTSALESLLIGHEDWVHTVCWQPTPSCSNSGSSHSNRSSDPHNSSSSSGGGDCEKGWGESAIDRGMACLLTASMDRTMVLWKHEPRSGLWMNVSSLGDAGTSCLGYFGGSYSPDASHIVAHGFTGALHLWEHASACSPAPDSDGRPSPDQQQILLRPSAWVPKQAMSGHFRSVADVCWGVDGSCVASAGCDQTTRIFAAVRALPGSTASSSGSQQQQHWCEVARPQVHGHDFSCIAFVPFKSTTLGPSANGGIDDGCDCGSHTKPSLVYVSGSEEKVLRVFEATQAFLHTLTLLRGLPGPGEMDLRKMGGRAFGASVAALGLTNKAVFEEAAGVEETEDVSQPVGNSVLPGAGYADGPDFVPNAMPGVVQEPPLEEHLAQNTLWPEVRKLYGHGDNLYCVAPSPDGALIASACVAKSETAALIWVWDTKDWKGIAQLPAHTLTVTQLAWSHSGRFLASASRDRSFTVFEHISPPPPTPNQPQPPAAQTPPASFQLLQRVKVAHTRVLWGICWSHDDALIATASRDNTVKLWDTMCGQGSSSSSSSSSGGGTEATGTQAHTQAGGQAAPSVSGRPVLTLPAFPSAVTAVAFAPAGCNPSWQGEGEQGGRARGECKLLAVGLESGAVQLWGVRQRQQPMQAQGSGCVGGEGGHQPQPQQPQQQQQQQPQQQEQQQEEEGDGDAVRAWPVWQSDEFCSHAGAVNKLSWRPLQSDSMRGSSPGSLQLASCSDDHSVRVFSIDMGRLQ